MYLKKYMEYYKIEKLNGILADLGLSSHHIDEASRGFSIHSNLPLDMRMNTEQTLTAKEVIMKYPVHKLEHVIKTYGEITNAKKIAEELVKERARKSFNSCKEFANWAEAFSYGKPNKFLAQLFQAFRIEVNHEIDSLKLFLKQGADLLMPGGRMVIISYHSLEDRLVKQWFKTGDPDQTEESYFNAQTPFNSLHKQTIKPDQNEVNRNSRARSAKMRTGIKK
jgi:16S rRNA (cytosine1402-N4)-methyltransferase